MSLQYLTDWELEGHSQTVTQIVWTAGGIVLSASLRGDIKAWDPADGSLVWSSEDLDKMGIWSIGATADGKQALSTSPSGSVKLWAITPLGSGSKDTPLLKVVAETSALPGRVGLSLTSSAIHPGGLSFAVCGSSNVVSCYSLEPFGKLLASLELGKVENSGQALAFARDGRLLAATASDGQVFLFDAETYALRTIVSEHANPVRAVTFASPATSSSPSLLLLGSGDRRLTVHDVQGICEDVNSEHEQSIDVVASLQGHRDTVSDVQCGTGDRIVASCSHDCTLKIWDLSGSPKSCVWTQTETSAPSCLSWRPMNVVNAHSAMSAITESTDPDPSRTAFVAGFQDGSIRFYRAAGIAASR